MKLQIRKGCFETDSSSMHSLIITKKDHGIRMTQEEIRDEFYLDCDWYKKHHKNDDVEVVKINPWDNDYGRSPFTILTSFEDKLSYAIAEYCGNSYSAKSYTEGISVYNEIFLPLLVRLIGCDDVEWGKFDTRHFIIYSDVNNKYLDDVEEVPYERMVFVDTDERKTMSEDELVNDRYKNVDKDGRPIEDAWFKVPEFGSIDHQSVGRLKGFLKANNISLEDYLVRKDIVVVIDGDEHCELGNLIDCGLISKDAIVIGYPKYAMFGYGEGDEDEVTDQE